MKPLKQSQRLNLDKIKNRPRTLADILAENEEMESAGKGIPEELIKPMHYDHSDYYEGMDGPTPPAMVMDVPKNTKHK